MILGFCEYQFCLSYATVEKVIKNQVTPLCEEHYMELVQNG